MGTAATQVHTHKIYMLQIELNWMKATKWEIPDSDSSLAWCLRNVKMILVIPKTWNLSMHNEKLKFNRELKWGITIVWVEIFVHLR